VGEAAHLLPVCYFVHRQVIRVGSLVIIHHTARHSSISHDGHRRRRRCRKPIFALAERQPDSFVPQRFPRAPLRMGASGTPPPEIILYYIEIMSNYTSYDGLANWANSGSSKYIAPNYSKLPPHYPSIGIILTGIRTNYTSFGQLSFGRISPALGKIT
jgi:hypothetical protein